MNSKHGPLWKLTFGTQATMIEALGRYKNLYSYNAATDVMVLIREEMYEKS